MPIIILKQCAIRSQLKQAKYIHVGKNGLTFKGPLKKRAALFTVLM